MSVELTKSSATAEQIAEARDWIADAYPANPLDGSDTHPIYDEIDAAVCWFIRYRYPGGWAAFVEECCTFVQL